MAGLPETPSQQKPTREIRISMDDRLERLRRRVHLSDRVLEDIGAALSDPARSLDDILLEMGFDSRDVERKKYGRAGARRSFQFSKR